MPGGALLSLEKIRTLKNEGCGNQKPELKRQGLKLRPTNAGGLLDGVYGRLNEDYASGDSAGPQGTSER
jgi:hypothetical protein